MLCQEGFILSVTLAFLDDLATGIQQSLWRNP